jgi:Ca2+-binding EF-hand superfamily protein
MDGRFFIGAADLATRLRTRCDHRGLTGLRGVGVLFRQAEENGDQELNVLTDIPKILSDFGVFMNKTEIVELGRHLEVESVTLSEFLNYFVLPIPTTRETWVTKAYNKFDANGSGSIGLAAIRRLSLRGSVSTRLAAPPNSPEVLFQKLIRYYEDKGEPAIPKEEFFDYYRLVSANFEVDREFILLIQNTWGIGI